MKIEEKKIVNILDAAVRDISIKQHLDIIIKRVEKSLEDDDKDTLMAWEAIPLDLYNQPLPDEIKSSWVFVLRKNTISGAERHPNSIQRMMSYKGKGDFQTKPGLIWQSNFLISDLKGDIKKRWISIPQNIWHQGIVGEDNWVVISFHTVVATDLIEERPDKEDEKKIHQKYYINKLKMNEYET